MARMSPVGPPGADQGRKPARDPNNLGKGGAGFDFGEGLRQADEGHQRRDHAGHRSYQGGRMLFLGLGTGPGLRDDPDGVLRP